MHVRGHEATTASMVADLPEDPGEPVRVWAAPGNPCVAPFLPVAAPAADPVIPGVLGDTTAWEAFAALSRAVEAPGDAGCDALVRIRGSMAPVEARAWEEADELWGARAGADRWREAADRWDQEVRAALGDALVQGRGP
jgi:hypothetical protein